MKYSLFLLIWLILFSTFSALAQNDLAKGLELYKAKNYDGAVSFFKNFTKTNSADANAWYYLGLAQMGDNKLKDAEKSLKKSLSINQNNSSTFSTLAYLYLLRNKSNEAREAATSSLKLDKQNADAQYVMGVIAFRDGFYNRSYDYAKKIIGIDSTYSSAYLLKAECLISSFIQQSGTVMLPKNQRADLLKEAKDDLEKYVSLAPQAKDIKFYQEYLESIKFFAEYYSKINAPAPTGVDASDPSNVYSTNIKVLTKPRAEYSEQARQAGVQGLITLLVNFSDKGTIKDILVLKPLGFGLDQAAIQAAHKIKFKPAEKSGTPVSVVKMVQYTFTLY